MTFLEIEKMTTEEVKNKAGYCGGLLCTADRFNTFFDEWEWDNSYNWDCPIYWEVRSKGEVTFIWIAESSKCDPRGADYADENCVMFLNANDYFEFADELRPDDEEE